MIFFLQFISQRSRSILRLSRIAQTERRRGSPDRRHDRNHEKVAQLFANGRIEERKGDLARDLRIGINAHVKIDTLAIFTIVRSSLKIDTGWRGRVRHSPPTNF